MKKLLILMTAFAVMTLSACKKDDKNVSINSTWKWEKAISKTDASNVHIPEEPYFIQLKSDGSFFEVMFNKGETQYTPQNARNGSSGTFTREGNLLTFSHTAIDGGLEAGTYKFEGDNQLRIDISEGADNYYLIFKKVNLEVKPLLSQLK
jgi:hypothetical protein